MSLTVTYDEPSDSLHIDTCPPYREQGSDELTPGVLARFNPDDGTIENIEILSFRARLAAGKKIELPAGIHSVPIG
jgi:hypothetical protein